MSAHRSRDRRRELAKLMGIDQLHIFVPAVMSIGLVFWVVSELRELVRDSRIEARDKRAMIGAVAVADSVIGVRLPRGRDTRGLRPRLLYLVVAVGLLGIAAYLSVGLFARQRHDLRGTAPGISADAWLLALAASLGAVLVLYGVAAGCLFVRYDRPAAWADGVVSRCMLSLRPVDPREYPGHGSRRVTTAFTAATVGALLLAVVVAWAPLVLEPFDDAIADWLRRHDSVDMFSFLDPLGKTEVMLAFTLLAGVAALRCRVLGAAYATATVAGLLVSVLVRPVVARARPPYGPHGGAFDSFPSGHMLLAVLFAGVMPLALAVLLDRRWLVRPLRIVMAVGVLASAVHRVSGGTHWPTDVIGGALVGLALVLAVEWSVQTERAHRLCHGCLWAHDDRAHERGLLHLPRRGERGVRLAAHVAAAAAVVGLTVLTLTRGVPKNDDGFVFAENLQVPVQLVLAGLVSVGALVAWKWDAVGAVIIAVAAAGLGVFAAVQYPTMVAVGMTVVLLVPAVLLWLGWQHRRSAFEIVAVALVTSLLVGGTWIGARTVYSTYFGPTHPVSAAPAVAVDRVDWMWAGGLSPTSLTVAARLADDARSARVVFEDPQGGSVSSTVVAAGEHRIVQLRVDALRPNTEYAYHLEVDGVADQGRGVGRVRTPVDGAMSFTIAFGSCARVGSNGAVFDAIRAKDPLMYLVSGDLYYGNLEATTVGPFLDAFDRVLTAPGQAALYRQTPIAYVWDDHDYGPDNADASSPGRAAARAAYRTAVPSYDVMPGDAPINQAFTIGRVRFVITDGRSERTPDTMLGEEQLQWLLAEVTEASRTHALVVWISTSPWIGDAEAGADFWAGFADERRTIADAIADAGVDNLVVLSGDAHMVAIDDGTNSGYASDGSPGFPVMNAAALDRPGNLKGGPYSEGMFPGGGQFGTIDVVDDGGDSVDVTLTGWRWNGDELVSFTVDLAG